jgi:hypothetical protein
MAATKMARPLPSAAIRAFAGASYCAPHFHLTRGDGTASERAAGPIVLRLVAVA